MTTILSKTGTKGNAIEIRAEVRSKWGEEQLMVVAYVDGKEFGTGDITVFPDSARKGELADYHWLAVGKIPLKDEEGRATKEAFEALQRARWAAEREQLEEAVPGYGELKTAHSEWAQYDEAMRQFIGGDGLRGRKPQRPTSNLDDLKGKYPRALAYLVAESQSRAANAAKAAAGRKAMGMLRAGTSIEEAQAVLDGWLTDEMRWS